MTEPTTPVAAPNDPYAQYGGSAAPAQAPAAASTPAPNDPYAQYGGSSAEAAAPAQAAPPKFDAAALVTDKTQRMWNAASKVADPTQRQDILDKAEEMAHPPSTLHKVVKWAADGLFSDQTVTRFFTGHTAEELNDLLTPSDSELLQRSNSPDPQKATDADYSRFLVKSGLDLGKTLNNMFLSPLGITTIGGGEVLGAVNSARQVVQTERAVQQSMRVLETTDALHQNLQSGIRIAAQQAEAAEEAARVAEAELAAGKGSAEAAQAARTNATEAMSNLEKTQKSLDAVSQARKNAAFEFSKHVQNAAEAAKADAGTGAFGTKYLSNANNLTRLMSPEARAALVSGKVAQAAHLAQLGAGTAFTANSIVDALEPRHEGENDADYMGRVLSGLGWGLYGSAETAKGFDANTLKQIPESVRSTAEAVRDWVRESPENKKQAEAALAWDKFQKAIPNKGKNQFDFNDWNVWRLFAEPHHETVQPVRSVKDVAESAEYERQKIEDLAREKARGEKYGSQYLIPDTENGESLQNDVRKSLQSLEEVSPGYIDDALASLEHFNLTDMTVAEADKLRTHLNDLMRGKIPLGKYASDVRAGDPEFAGYEALNQAIKGRIEDRLIDMGAEGVADSRQAESSLIRVRNAAQAVLRSDANAGSKTVRGSGENGPVRKGLAWAARTAGTAGGALLGAGSHLPLGWEAGAALGGLAGNRVARMVTTPDLTRDQLIESHMEDPKGNPIQVAAGEAPQITERGDVTPTPPLPIPPAPAPVNPLEPRPFVPEDLEGSKLHSRLAAYFGYVLGAPDTPSFAALKKKFLEQQQDLKITGAEKPKGFEEMVQKLGDAQAEENQARKEHEKEEAKRLEAEKAKTVTLAKTLAGKSDQHVEVNPILAADGLGHLSGMVSHPLADNMMAHSEPMKITDLPEGISSEDAHREEWAHIAVGLLDGLDGREIWSSNHEGVGDAAAAAIFTAPNDLRNPDGTYNGDAVKKKYVQWLTQKMAGPASHDVFSNKTYEELKAGKGHRGDFNDARAMVRSVHPEYTPQMVEADVEAAYERAKSLLMQKHIADRIRANAAVRENNLPDTHHASAGRIARFKEDLMEAHNEHGTNDLGPDGGGNPKGGKGIENAGEGGSEGEAESRPAAEKTDEGRETGEAASGARGSAGDVQNPGGGVGVEEKSNLDLEKAREPVRKERTTGDEKIDETIRQAGGVPSGSAKNFPFRNAEGNFEDKNAAYITEPKYGSTGIIPFDEVTPERIKSEMERMRAAWEGKTEQSNLSADAMGAFREARQATEGEKTEQPKREEAPVPLANRKAALRTNSEGSANTPTAQQAVEKSALTKDEHQEVLDGIKRSYGVHDDPKLQNNGGFITPEGRFIDLPSGVDHTDAIESHGGEPVEGRDENGNAVDNRRNFINETGAIRSHKARERGGEVLSYSVPKGGIGPEQLDALKQSVGANVNRNGVLRIERADISPETRNTLSTEKEFPSVRDVEPMLQKIQAHPDQVEKSSLVKNDAGHHEHDPEWQSKYGPHAQLAAHEANGGSTFSPTGENLAGKDVYSVATHPENTKIVDKLTPAVLDAYKAEHPGQSIGTWRDPETGKIWLDTPTTIADRDAAIAAGKAANQKAIYHLGTGETIPTGGTGEAPAVEQSNLQKGTISTRLPSGKKATENPLGDSLTIGRDSIDKVPGLPEKVASKIKKYTGLALPAKLSAPEVLDHFVNHVKENLKDLYNQVPKEQQEANGKWYDSANKLANDMAKEHGLTEEQASGTIAAMSPQKDWNQNVSLAKRVTDIWNNKSDIPMTPEMEAKGKELATNKNSKGELTNPKLKGILKKIKGKSLSEITDPVEKAAWVRVYDEAHNSRDFQRIDPATGNEVGVVKTDAGVNRKVAWGSLNEIGKALSILEDGSHENISGQLGEAHKVRNFYNNILDPNNPAGHVTIDTHAVAAGMQKPLSGKSLEVKDNFGGIGSKQTGAKGLYALYADAYRQAAGELGIQPRQLQSVVWEEVRNQFPDEFKRAGTEDMTHPQAIENIWKGYDAGKTTLEQTRQAVRDYAKDTVAKMEQNKPAAKAKGKKAEAPVNQGVFDGFTGQ